MSRVSLREGLDPDRLLDREWLAATLARGLGDAGAALRGAEPFYLRAKPGRSALLGVRLTWSGVGAAPESLAAVYLGEDAAAAAAKAATLRIVEAGPGPALARLDDPPALLLAFPNDRELRGLPAASNPRRLGNRLSRPGAHWIPAGTRVSARRSTVTLARWKPGRRAVLRARLVLRDETRGTRESVDVWVRVVPASELAARVAAWRAGAKVAGVRSPRVFDADPDRGLFVTEGVEGKAFASVPLPPGVPWEWLGETLHRLHGSVAPLARRTDAHDLGAALETLAMLSSWAPELAARADGLRRRLGDWAGALAPAPVSLVHGDLTADQILIERSTLALLDWDEAALADPHADYATLAADLRRRGAPAAGEQAQQLEVLAARALGARFSPRRWRWQCALAEVRGALAGLQQGRAAWRREAETALSAAASLLETRAPAARADTSRTLLAALVDPARRAGLPGLDGRALVLTAVWPDRERDEAGAVIARLEAPGAPGIPDVWLRVGRNFEAHTFPADPALPTLSTRLAGGGFVVAGHRLLRRAALRALDGSGFLYLRPERALGPAHARALEAMVRLRAAGVLTPRVLVDRPAPDGWWAEAVAGAPWVCREASADAWHALGETLARAHRAGAGCSPARDPIAETRCAASRQLAPLGVLDPTLAAALAAELPAAGVPGTPAWIHGDLHPTQVVAGGETAILDWERARPGHAEEDLGNLAGHLAWEMDEGADSAWAAFSDGYRGEGGSFSKPAVAAHARGALVRLLAIHSWRDAARARALDLARWRERMKEVCTW